MRVRISYAVDLADVPGEVVRMLEDNSRKLQELLNDNENLIRGLEDKTIPAYRVKDTIQNIRMNLGKLDSIYADNDSILEGYYQALQAQPGAVMPEEVDDASQG
tara:strand:- start:1285 stop:1596 length:312 start_codon:yes stop_codon:yes gene_type:complete